MTNTKNVRPEIWNSTTYDAMRRKLIPSFDLLYDSAVHAVIATVPARARILDLGAGTGLLGAAVLRRLPEAELLLLDHSEAMLDKARQRFVAEPRVSVVVSDMKDPLPEGTFDAVISALAIHHLTHAEKKNLFKRIRKILTPGGTFVNVEQIAAPTSALEMTYDHLHEAHVLASECPVDEWAAGRERMKLDICADLASQLEWLRKAGFSHVDCLAKDWRFGTYAGWVAS